MQRRQLIKALIATTIAGHTLGGAAAEATERAASHGTARDDAASANQDGRYPWRNWSGNQHCLPQERAEPRSIAALQALLKQAPEGQATKLRAVGAGHSFSALVPTDQMLLSTRGLAGLDAVFESQQQARFYAGTVLRDMGPALHAHGQALMNMPDIDQQTLGGSIATATHGTGQQLGCLSAYVTEIEMALANGELLTCNAERDSDVFRAAQVSLGSLGMMTRITLQNTAAFKLKRHSAWLDYDTCVAQAYAEAAKHRHFEFFYFPFTGMALTDALSPTTEAPYSEHEIDGNSGILDLKMARDYLGWSSRLRQLILQGYMRTIAPTTQVNHSYAIYANARNVRFNEMEYHLPVTEGLQALDEIRHVIERSFPETFFPIECRFIQQDEAWLSPFYRQETMSIAVHRYFEEDYRPLFTAIEPILLRHQGRPHWGKIHTLKGKELAARYPQWQSFARVRRELDPYGRFLNGHLSALFT